MKYVMTMSLPTIVKSQNHFQIITKNKVFEYSKFLENTSTLMLYVKGIETQNDKIKDYLVQKITCQSCFIANCFYV